MHSAQDCFAEARLLVVLFIFIRYVINAFAVKYAPVSFTAHFKTGRYVRISIETDASKCQLENQQEPTNGCSVTAALSVGGELTRIVMRNKTFETCTKASLGSNIKLVKEESLDSLHICTHAVQSNIAIQHEPCK